MAVDLLTELTMEEALQVYFRINVRTSTLIVRILYRNQTSIKIVMYTNTGNCRFVTEVQPAGCQITLVNHELTSINFRVGACLEVMQQLPGVGGALTAHFGSHVRMCRDNVKKEQNMGLRNYM